MIQTLYIKNLNLVQNNQVLITNFSQTFFSGRIYALWAKNGAGKTTLLKTIARLLPCQKNTIFFENRDVLDYCKNSRSKLISMLLQQTPSHHHAKARARISHGLIPLLGLNKLNIERDPRIDSIAKKLSVTHLLDRKISRLSGGEQRLVYLAKTLVNDEAKILLLDEPSVFLDHAQKIQLASILKAKAKKGACIVFSSHDWWLINSIASDIIEFNRQEIKSSIYQNSDPSFLLNNPFNASLAERSS